MAAEAQIPRNYNHGKLTPITNRTMGQITMLNAPIGVSSGLYTNGGPFDDSADLIKLREYIYTIQDAGFTEESFERVINQVGTFIKTHEQEHSQGYITLGMIYRYAYPETFRNFDLALQYYSNTLSLIPQEDHISRAQILYLMSDCIDAQHPELHINNMARYLGKAADVNHYYACGLGDIYINGWGCYMDAYLSYVMYDVAQRFGDESSYTNACALEYFLDHPLRTSDDSIAAVNYVQYLYYIRITEDYGKARQYAILSAEKGFAPAYYAMATLYESILPNLSQEQRRKDTYYWMQRGASLGYTPCIEGMARIITQYNIDTARGPLISDLPNNQFSDRIKSECAKQAFLLRQRSAEHGNVISIRRLGLSYMEGNKYGYPSKDYEKAYILLSATAYHGNLRAEQDLSRLMIEYTPSKRDSAVIDDKIHAIVERINKHNDIILDKAYNSKDFHEPIYINRWSSQEFNASKELEQHPLYWSHLIKSYQVAIQCYKDLQKEIEISPTHYRIMVDTYCKKRIQQLEERLQRF